MLQPTLIILIILNFTRNYLLYLSSLKMTADIKLYEGVNVWSGRRGGGAPIPG
jgi:hypothetical protein